MHRREFIGGSAALLATASAPNKAPISEPAITFYSDFWVNLHHTLYRQADALQTAYNGGTSSLHPIPRQFYEDATHLPRADQAAWYRALESYQRQYAQRNFVFDDQLIRIENALADGAPPGDLKRILASVAPIYRNTLWPAHDELNRRRIEQWRQSLAQYGPTLMPTLSRLYQAPWLRIPYRVDVVASTDRDGAFSIYGPKFWHIVTSSFDRQNYGLNGFEIIVHEASHSIVSPDSGPIGRSIAVAAGSLNRPEPADLWHVVIMYAPGSVLRELVAKAHGAPYTPAFVANDVLPEVYPRYYAALKQHFQPYVDGLAPLEPAMEQTVKAIVG